MNNEISHNSSVTVDAGDKGVFSDIVAYDHHSPITPCPVFRPSHEVNEVTYRSPDDVAAWNELQRTEIKWASHLCDSSSKSPSTNWLKTLKDMTANC